MQVKVRSKCVPPHTGQAFIVSLFIERLPIKIDTLLFDFKGKKGSYTILFSFRATGVLATVDTGKSVRFVSSGEIPWAAYISAAVS